jgi:uncharacterized protein YcfJ
VHINLSIWLNYYGRKLCRTLIGAGAGAVTGAVISKKKGKGAIIGGVVGATGGYLLGRHKDKKHPVTGTKTKIKTQ